jgi:transcriptional regulator with XRE-family HTH domain
VRKRANRKNVAGRRVGEARGKFNPPLTQDALSGKLAALGVQLDRAAIAKIENGHRRIYDYELRVLAKALNVKVDWLFGGD